MSVRSKWPSLPKKEIYDAFKKDKLYLPCPRCIVRLIVLFKLYDGVIAPSIEPSLCMLLCLLYYYYNLLLQSLNIGHWMGSSPSLFRINSASVIGTTDSTHTFPNLCLLLAVWLVHWSASTLACSRMPVSLSSRDHS